MAFFPIPSDLPRTTATVDFIEESRFADVKPYTIAVDELPKEYEDKRTNVVFKPGTINVADLRGYENRLHINDHLVQLVTKRSDWLENNGKDVAENVVSYIKETVDLIKDFRSSEEPEIIPGQPVKPGTRGKPDKPLHNAHTDLTQDAGLQRAKHQLSTEAVEQYLRDGRRLRVINAWRPLRSSVEDYPLAIADPSSIQSTDTVAADLITKTYLGEYNLVKYRPYHKWYWFSEQSPSEVLLFTNWDSRVVEGRISQIPHVSFRTDVDMSTQAAPRHRQSVEVRAVVVGPKPEGSVQD